MSGAMWRLFHVVRFWSHATEIASHIAMGVQPANKLITNVSTKKEKKKEEGRRSITIAARAVLQFVLVVVVVGKCHLLFKKIQKMATNCEKLWIAISGYAISTKMQTEQIKGVYFIFDSLVSMHLLTCCVIWEVYIHVGLCPPPPIKFMPQYGFNVPVFITHICVLGMQV